MGRSAPSGVRRAPAVRAAVAAAMVAIAASVLVGLGHAQEHQQVSAADLQGVPAAAATRQAPAQATPTPTRAGRSSERAAPGQVRAAAPRPATPESTGRRAAPRATSEAPRPTERTAAAAAAAPRTGPVVDGGPPRVAGTPCTVTARACVALGQRLAWLIDGGTVVRGPVPVQHGDVRDPTPRGTFKVQWKAEQYTSREYLTQMPYSVFFADGGIAFHEGAQDTPSAGCVKLGPEDARAWFAFLQVDDEVQIH